MAILWLSMQLDGEDGVEDVVPNLAGDSEAKVEVLVVMCEMILLHVADVGRESRVVETASKTVRLD